jgi:anhydro-N-acetylmuramic acid kinase
VRVIGMMSGTSADGIDAVLTEIEGAPPRLETTVRASLSVPFPAGLQERIHAAARADTSDIESICLLDVELGERFAETALDLTRSAGMAAAEIDGPR